MGEQTTTDRTPQRKRQTMTDISTRFGSKAGISVLLGASNPQLQFICSNVLYISDCSDDVRPVHTLSV